MNRRAWLLGGTAVFAASATPLFQRLRTLDAAETTGVLTHREGPLLLREGFHCKVIAQSGELLSDGSRSADLPDGMACFASESGEWILLRNHELDQAPRSGAFPGATPIEAFDPPFQGGVSRLVLDARTLSRRFANTVLTGTHRNCGGGVSPFGFLSCEESRLDGHGYVFLCRPDASRVAPAHPVFGYGRFRHEAACVDPTDFRAYLTEDETDGCFYRFSPRSKDAPFDGELEALSLPEFPRRSTSHLLKQGQSTQVSWVPVADPGAHRLPTRRQAQAQGAAPFVRGEGAWLQGKSLVFACTEGGRAGLGQLFHLDLEKDRLTLMAESTSEEEFAHPDNITIAPWGDVILAEDTFGACHIRGVTAHGHSYPIALNRVSSGEIAGVCFSPDGRVLFCNLQRDGLTVAISGPFETLWEQSTKARSRV